jgi:DNA helicase-2/ATP-dependent DNA helicase PcrA
MQLNAEQEMAASHVDGPALVTACPGSGKTRTVVERTARLIAGGIDPKSIMCITFTNKAADEMRERVKKTVNEAVAKKIWISTFHRLGCFILRKQGHFIGYNSGMTICMPDDQTDLISQCARQLGHELTKPVVKKIAWQVNDSRENLETHDQFEDRMVDFGRAIKSESVMSEDAPYYIGKEYLDRLRETNQIDFTGMLSETVRLLQESKPTLDKLHSFFRYFIVDEAQDSNLAQMKIIELVAAATKNVMLVGDLDQCVAADSCLSSQGSLVLAKSHPLTVTSWSGLSLVDSTVADIHSKNITSNVVKINTVSGRTLTTTSGHFHFANYGKQSPNKWIVYLMEKENLGYRIGLTRVKRKSSSGYQLGFKSRLHAQGGDRMWLLHAVDNEEDARVLESVVSLKYSLPQTVFKPLPKQNISNQYVRRIFESVDTQKNANRLLKDCGLQKDVAHHVAEGFKQRNVLRVRRHAMTRGKYSYHSYCMYGTDSDLAAQLIAKGLKVKYTRKKENLWRLSSVARCLTQIEPVIDIIRSIINVHVVEKANFGDFESHVIPASYVLPGMMIPVLDNGKLVEDEVLSVEKFTANIDVTDVAVPKNHNYIANGIVTSNSIYGWRGARAENISEFVSNYKPKIIRLGKNYRSTPQIIKVADKLIRHNTERIAADFSTDNPNGPPVTCKVVETSDHEAKWVGEMIANLTSKGGFKKTEIAVFYRLNTMSRAIEMAMMHYGISYELVGDLSFFDRKEVKDTIAMLKFFANRKDGISFHRFCNKPRRQLGDTAVGKIENYAKANTNGDILESLKDIGKIIKAETVQDGALDILKAYETVPVNGAPAEIMAHLIKTLKYEDHLVADAKEPSEVDDRKANIEELINSAAEFTLKGQGGIHEYLESISLNTNEKEKEGEDEVHLMSAHASKGLEFPVVFIVGAEQGIMPHSRAIMERDDGLAEERRLMYVAVTRAQKVLCISYCRRRARSAYGGKGKINYSPSLPSQFLYEMELVKKVEKPKERIMRDEQYAEF